MLKRNTATGAVVAVVSSSVKLTGALQGLGLWAGCNTHSVHSAWGQVRISISFCPNLVLPRRGFFMICCCLIAASAVTAACTMGPRALGHPLEPEHSFYFSLSPTLGKGKARTQTHGHLIPPPPHLIFPAHNPGPLPCKRGNGERDRRQDSLG